MAQGERGMALVLVLSFAAALSGMAVLLLNGMREGAEAAHGIEQLLKRRIAVDSAIELAAARLRDPASEPFDTMTFELADMAVEIDVEAESSRINLNDAAPEELEQWIADVLKAGLEEDAELALTLAHRIVDWRDENDLRQLQGAEADDYRRAGLDYAPTDGPFRHISELRDVMGIDGEILEMLTSEAAVVTGAGNATIGDEITGDEAVGDEALAAAEADALEAEGSVDEVESGDDPAAQSDQDVAGDSGNIYRLHIAVRSADNSRLISEALIWTEPSDGGETYQVLDYQPFVLPRAVP